MIGIVSGYMRSGTSCMMQALEAGGMCAMRSLERDKAMHAQQAKISAQWGDAVADSYRPNDQYYELNPSDYHIDDFPLMFDGRLIKCLAPGVMLVSPAGRPLYRCVFMRRNRRAIADSVYAMTGRVPSMLESDLFDRRMAKTVDCLRDRKSFVSVEEVWFDEMVRDPRGTFERLLRAGWPIDPAVAAEVPDSSKRRMLGAAA